MRTETLSTLKINKLSQEQYDRELANGNIDENAIYLTPDTELDLAEVEQTLKEQGDEIEVVKGDLTSHTNSSNAQFTLVREEFANADAETLKSAKEYSDANKNSAVGEAKAYTDQEIEKLVTDTEFEGVLSTIQDIQNAMATDEELAQALETANGKKVDKGAKGSATQPIYFDDNGAQPIAYTIEKSVPADAKFTDTTYTLIKDSTNKKIQLMNGNILVSEVDDNNTTYDLATAEKAGLMSLNDKTKLDGIEEEANKTIIDSELSINSENPVQNRVINAALNDKLSFDEEVVNSENSAIKAVPKGSGRYVVINKVGGMSYKSRNLINANRSNTNVKGITYTVNTDKSISIGGTPTDTTSWKGYELTGRFYLPSGKYTFICTGYKNLNKIFPLIYDNTTGATLTSLQGTQGTASFEITTGMTVYAYIGCRPDYTPQGEKLYIGLYRADETNTSYEPYYSGLRNSYVSKITSVVGKNLLNNTSTTLTYTGVTFTTNEDKSVTVKGTSTWWTHYKLNQFLLPAGTYTLSLEGGINATLYVHIKDLQGNSIIDTYGTMPAEMNFTLTKDTEIIVNLSISPEKTVDTIVYPMIRRAEETDSTYEPYREDVFTIPTGARGVGYGMGINKDCYNYIDFERKVYVQRCKKVSGFVLTGTNTNTKVFTAYVSGLIGGVEGSNNVLCSHLDIYGFHTQDNPHFYIDSNWNTINVYLPISVDDSVASEIEVIAALTTPIETDISDFIQDNFIEVAAGGVITAVNEYNYDVPTEISFFTSGNPEKVIVADKIVGDLVGIAEEAQSLTGLESTIEELNYLHKGTVIKEGWLIPEEGTETIEVLCGTSGVLGLKIGNTYTFTVTYKDGTTKTENVIAIDNPDEEFVPGVVVLRGNLFENIIIIDKANIDSEFNIITGTNHYWYPPSVVDEEIVSILVTGTKSDGNILTHQEEFYNKIPLEHLPDSISNISTQPPIIQEWEWTSNDTGKSSDFVDFQKPEGYNRCEIFVFDRKLKSSGSATIYGTLMIPMCKEDGNDWNGYTYAGEAVSNAKLGMGEGTTTTGGTEWITTLKGECNFLEQGCIFTYHYGAVITKHIDISSEAGAPSTFIGQFSCVLKSDSDKTSILDSSLQWHFFALPEENKGNYIKIVWHKD